jgi:DnaJ-class molecular chaperone
MSYPKPTWTHEQEHEEMLSPRNYTQDDEEDDRNAPCSHCHGTGAEPYDDGITPCEHCDGEGYEYWKH